VQLILLFTALFAVAGVGVLLYLFHKQIQTPQTKALDAIPTHTALFFESRNPDDFFSFNADAQSLFNLFLNEKQQQHIQKMVSLLSDKQDFDIKKYSNGFYVSVHPFRSKTAMLFCIETEKRHNKELKSFAQQIANQYYMESFTYKNNEMQKLHIDSEILYLNSQNGLLLLSFDESLLRASIDQILLKDSVLHKVVHSFAYKRDANVSLRLYLQYAQCEPVFKKIWEAVDGNSHITCLFTPFSWSALNVKQKNNEIVFSGYAAIDTTATMAKLFTHKDKAVDMAKLLPSNAQRIFCLNAGNYQRFSRVKPYVQVSEDVFALMYPKQVITFEINHNDTISNAMLLVSENPSEAAFHLFNSVGSEFTENQYHLDTFYIHTAMVGKVNLNNFLITRLGYNQHFPRLHYYTIWENNIVFTDSKDGIISYIQHLRNGNTLKTNENYQKLQSYFSNQANIFYYNESPQKPIQQIRFQYDYSSDGLFLLDAGVRVKR
jgi:hypothetical protein